MKTLRKLSLMTTALLLSLACEVEDANPENPSVDLADINEGEGSVIVYGDLSASFTGEAVMEETFTSFGATFTPDYEIDEYTVAITTSDFSAQLRITFFIEYPESAADNIRIFTEKYNIIDLNDTDAGGVLYARPFLTLAGNTGITLAELPEGLNSVAEITSVTAEYLEGTLNIQNIENNEGDVYSIEAAFKATRQ